MTPEQLKQAITEGNRCPDCERKAKMRKCSDCGKDYDPSTGINDAWRLGPLMPLSNPLDNSIYCTSHQLANNPKYL